MGDLHSQREQVMGHLSWYGSASVRQPNESWRARIARARTDERGLFLTSISSPSAVLHFGRRRPRPGGSRSASCLTAFSTRGWPSRAHGNDGIGLVHGGGGPPCHSGPRGPRSARPWKGALRSAMNRLAKECVEKSDADLATAKRELAATTNPNHDAVCFHAQQCLEKLMKAVLAENGAPFPKTHDLIVLEPLVKQVAGFWTCDRNDLLVLAPAAVDYRYPGFSAAALPRRRDPRPIPACHRLPTRGLSAPEAHVVDLDVDLDPAFDLDCRRRVRRRCRSGRRSGQPAAGTSARSRP
jgi:HEPN domain-containing protein